MDSARWERIQTVFHGAADLPHPEQQAFVKSECGDDDSLAADVMALLAEDARGSSLLDRGLAQVANQIIGESSPPSLAVKEIGPYRIRDVLGEGGMGLVYLAEREDLHSLVAIKILRDAWLSPARRERFATEQRTLAQLNHPSIARLYDADTLADGTPCFVMEYVEGIPLTRYCRERRSTIEERLRLFHGVCEAVQYAHQHAVIHRDLKPSNILVKTDGTVRLLDFGIAKQFESTDGALGGAQVDQTLTGLRLMTPAYAAPEQIRGERVGVQTDVYSLGVILYELLTGRLPFDFWSRTPAEAETMIVEREPERPSVAAKRNRESPDPPSSPLSASKGAWADLDVLCLTAMHKDVQRRYQSVEALTRDVDHYLAGEPLEARPDSLRYRLGKFVTRNQRAVSAAALVFVTVVSLVVFFTVRLAKARNAALAEAARTERVQRFMLNLFQGGDEAAGPADSLRVVTLLDRGVQQAQSLNAEPQVQAELYQNLGSIYQKLGKFEQANSLLQSSLEERTRLFGQDSPEVAENLVALGLLRDDQAQYAEAERLVRQGLDIDTRHLSANHPALARATFALGKVLEDRGEFSRAIQVLGEAVQLQSAPGAVKTDLAASLTELANTHYFAGHYDLANSLYHRALDMHQQLYGAKHPLVADDYGNLAAVQQDLGYYAEDERLNRLALEIDEAYYGKDHPKTATDLTTLGRALLYEKKLDEAVGLLQRALDIRERVYGPVHPSVASTLNELGHAAQDRGNYDEAEADFRREAEIYREIKGDHSYLVAVALSNVASVYSAKKDYAHAEQIFRDVVRRFTEALSADHVNTGIARIKLGRTLLRQNKFAEAQLETLAGYQILSKQSNPGVSFLQNARIDLAAEYEALHQPEEAAKYRAALSVPGGAGREAGK